MAWDVIVTDTDGRLDFHSFDERPEETWKGDVIRFSGTEDGAPLALFLSVSSVLSVVLKPDEGD